MLTTQLYSQDEAVAIAEVMPEFPGGMAGLAKYIGLNTKYPAEAIVNNYSGKVYVNFIIDTNGKVTSSKIIKSSGLKDLDAEANRVIKSMPDWKPGIDKGKKVAVFMTLPISFKNEGIVSAPAQTPEHEKAMKYWNEGHKLEQQVKFDKALEYYEKSLVVEPLNQYAMFDKGKMLFALGEKEKGCEIWNKMITNNLRKKEAEEYVKKYCVDKKEMDFLADQKSKNFFQEGMLAVQKGRSEAALRKFDSCLKYTPDHENALFNKAAMHFKLDQKNQACNTWNKIILLNKNDKEVEELIKKNCN